MSATLAISVAACTALACGAIALASWRALLRTGNRAIGLFVVAFALMGLKNGLKAGLAWSSAPESALLESLFSVADLAAVVLVAVPIVRGGRP